MTDRSNRVLSLVAVLAIAVGFTFAMTAPPERIQGEFAKIMFVHVPSAWLAFLAFGVTAIGGIIWLIKKDDSPFVDDQAKEALNFQITVFIAEAISGFLTMVVIGCVLLPVILIANFILCIVAAVAASRGEWYRYPMTLRLIS